MLSAGQRQQYVTVENPTRAADGDGGYTDTWASPTIANFWASIVPISAAMGSRLGLGGNTVTARATHLVRALTPDVTGVTTKSRLTTDTGSRLFVHWIGPDYEHNGETQMACEEVLT